MELEYKKMLKSRDVYVIGVVYTHGDNGYKSFRTTRFNSVTESYIIGWIYKFMEVSRKVHIGGFTSEFPPEELTYENSKIHIVKDRVVRYGCYGYTRMEIYDIQYFDKDGQEFLVTIKD